MKFHRFQGFSNPELKDKEGGSIHILIKLEIKESDECHLSSI